MGEGVAKQHGHRPGACVLCSQQETEHLRETFPPGSCRGDLGLRPSLMIVLGLHVAGSCSSIEDMILCSNRSPLSEDPGDQFLLDISARKKKSVSPNKLVHFLLSENPRRAERIPGLGFQRW